MPAAFFVSAKINVRDYGEYPECADENAYTLCECVHENVCLSPVAHDDDYGANHHGNERDCESILHGYGRVHDLLL